MPEATVAAIITASEASSAAEDGAAAENGTLEVPMTRRSSKLKRIAGYWCIPGGQIERGESACEAIICEVREAQHPPLAFTHQEVLAAFFLHQTGANLEREC